MQKSAVIAHFCRNSQNFERNERREFRSYQGARGTEFAKFFLKFSNLLSIFRFGNCKGQIHMYSHIAGMGKIILESYERYWRFTTEIEKTFSKLWPPLSSSKLRE